MSIKTAGVLGLVSAVAAATAPGAQAGPAPAPAVPVAASYAELLQPVPEAVQRLRASDAENAERPAMLIKAQYAPDQPVDHHHHHHWRRHRRHHHHHHHHHSND